MNPNENCDSSASRSSKGWFTGAIGGLIGGLAPIGYFWYCFTMEGGGHRPLIFYLGAAPFLLIGSISGAFAGRIARAIRCTEPYYRGPLIAGIFAGGFGALLSFVGPLIISIAISGGWK
jgi:hypothetical protein